MAQDIEKDNPETADLMLGVNEQTPREIVAELDKYIIGQEQAKRSVAIALRNRWRSRQLKGAMRDEVIPKNILMIGSTGVGKTEIARRLAKLVKAPFVKVEATKFTEVGYVGRDVDSIVRDLAEMAVRMVRNERMEAVKDKAARLAEERILDVFVPEPRKTQNPLGKLFGGSDDEEKSEEDQPKLQAGREWVRKRLAKGELENETIEIDVEESSKPMVGMFAGSSLEGMGDNLQDMIGNLMPKNHKKRKVTVAEARTIFAQEEAAKLIDMDAVATEALKLADKMDYHTVMWSWAYYDYDVNNQPDPADALAKAKNGLHPGVVYLFHTESTTNAAILGDLIDWIRAQGYEILPLCDINVGEK